MASKYDEYWINRLDAVSALIQEAQQNGISRRIDVSDITKYGERKSWYGDVVVSKNGISKGVTAHARSLGRIVFSKGLIKEGKFRFVIGSDLKLRVERLEVGEVEEPASPFPRDPYKEYSPKKTSYDPNSISTILSAIPTEIWNIIVEKEPEWRYMEKLLEGYGFGRFAVLMLAAGLNDFQLKGKAEVAYWPKIREILERSGVPDSLKDLERILSRFYRNERLPELKLRRLNRLLSSRLAGDLWSAKPDDVAKDFLKIWYKLANTMRQGRDAKTITFAMKCLGIALLMAGKTDFSFENIPIPVDYRVREFTKRLGVTVRDDEDVREFWNEVLKELRKSRPEVNMIHLDSLVWQIGVLSKPEIVSYFENLGLREVGERIAELVRW